MYPSFPPASGFCVRLEGFPTRRVKRLHLGFTSDHSCLIRVERIQDHLCPQGHWFPLATFTENPTAPNAASCGARPFWVCPCCRVSTGVQRVLGGCQDALVSHPHSPASSSGRTRSPACLPLQNHAFVSLRASPHVRGLVQETGSSAQSCPSSVLGTGWAPPLCVSSHGPPGGADSPA